jgi:hypothetical protein
MTEQPWLWWVGCHGGAGVTTLARVTGLGIDGGTAWPAPHPDSPPVVVVLVCRETARGTWAATGAVEQWRSGNIPGHTRLAGIVAIPASHRRSPRVALERLQLLAGWVPALWRLRWVEEYLATDDPGDLGNPPPDVVALRGAVTHAARLASGR